MRRLLPFLLFFLLVVSVPQVQGAHVESASWVVMDPIFLSINNTTVVTRLRGQVLSTGNETDLIALLNYIVPDVDPNQGFGTGIHEVTRPGIISAEVNLEPDTRYWVTFRVCLDVGSCHVITNEFGRDIHLLEFNTRDAIITPQPPTSPLAGLLIGLGEIFHQPATLFGVIFGFFFLIGSIVTLGMIGAPEKALIFVGFTVSAANVYLGLWHGVVIIVIAALIAGWLLLTYYGGNE